MISFVGAGPGAADLITLRGAQRLAFADIVVWAASLVSDVMLQHCRAGVVLHDSKTMTLDDVCHVFADNPHAEIVRLHSGDTSIYSAIGEQIAWCRTHGRDFDIVPGVSSMSAAAALAETELTIPGVSQSVVITRLARGTAASVPDSETIEAFAATGATLALFLSVTCVDDLALRLLSGRSRYTARTPVVVAYRASWPDERLIRSTISTLAADVRAAGLTATTLFLVGDALAGTAPPLASHVYAPTYATRFRDSVGVPSGE
jgi:precorrin-4/cobalt-precorrin-4 C11-methyltransferase